MVENVEIERFYARLFRQNERVMKLGVAAIEAAFKRESHLDAPNGAVGYRHIVVAGTNGKGQVSALLSNAYTLGGARCGLYTSPHLVDFRERMCVDGVMISRDEVAEIGNAVIAEYGGDVCAEFSGTTLTYFECCLIMATRFFNRSHCNFGVFEVGLGGRLDATNALSPSMSVITSIGFDHEAYLGHTLSEIAHEKAGIMRTGCPCVVGRTAVDDLSREAREKGVSSFDALGCDFDWSIVDGAYFVESRFGRFAVPGAEAMPNYQRDNVAVAMFSLLKAHEIGLYCPRSSIEDVFQTVVLRTQWVGRMWHVSPETAEKLGVADIVFDGAHNPDGVRAFCEAICQSNKAKCVGTGNGEEIATRRALVVNSCADKNIEAMFVQYLSVFEKSGIFVTPIGSTPRAMAPEAYCARVGIDSAQAQKSCREAINRAAEYVGVRGTIYVSGSLYLLGECLVELGETGALDEIFRRSTTSSSKIDKH